MPAPKITARTTWQAVVAAPGFALGLVCDDDELHAIEFLAPRAAQIGDRPLAAEAARQLSAWLDDPTQVFSLPLRAQGTPFQRRVWAQIAAIPSGETRSYGQLAQTLKNAPRAVGQACGANPFPVIVPCHRVLAANGGLGGFNRQGGGFLLDIKRWLLRHEGALGS
ncbi:MAG: methylated-DNA--[protein]-cysteine S-methyltransferase [Azonexus sp.]|nr:methylated-DNA--[protein]-cysteine S-methyltransferase [Azonexus sp.]MCK6412816.1 methylated-DNA--[protein]-cysteine S-methyltransferase [Azonexus sp.]